SKFINNKDKLYATVLFTLSREFFKLTIVNSLVSATWDRKSINDILYIFIAILSTKLVEKFADKTIFISRFFLGFIISSNALPLLWPNSLNNNPIKIAIGLVCSQINLLTPVYMIIIYFSRDVFPVFYEALISITKFEFVNVEICASILWICIGVFYIIPKVLEEENF
ncbi:hypothetical protein CONCODRAFT_80858, partial [Conidiobolus coronatus NRRL 28638]